MLPGILTFDTTWIALMVYTLVAQLMVRLDSPGSNPARAKILVSVSMGPKGLSWAS